MLVCIPSGWLAYVPPLIKTIKWVNGAGYRLEIVYSNRVDLNRSTCISIAKEGGEDLIMVDTDVTVENTPDELEQVLGDDKDADVVIGVVVSPLGVLTNPLPPPKVPKFEVDYGSLAFTYIPYRTIAKLEPVGVQEWNEKMKQEMYMTYTATTSEDVEFLTRLKKKGFKVIADKRIRLRHWKMVPLAYQEVHFEVQREE